MSPYLFTLVMEIMSLIVHEKVERNKEFEYHSGCKQMKLTHVCFADDLLMFCHGDKGSVKTLKEAIEEFGSVSGLKPNYDKSTVILGSIKEEDRQDILNCVPFKIEKVPIRYFGVPLTSKRISAKNFKSLIDKIKNKVCNWKSKCLSYAGRLLLIASVLESIHVYWASVFLLPKSVIYDINKLLKGFLWNQGDVSSGKAKVAWKNICRPKSKGGLGLKDLGVWNKAMIVKHLWHIINNKETLWVKWINTVKLKGRSVWAANEEINDSWG
ncbi:RNA-directed DNA polymerase, eukaryota, reverse transcriptase zinc-binding domain protein [Tanacetum coccineum]